MHAVCLARLPGLLAGRSFWVFCLLLGIFFRVYLAFSSSFWLDELWSSWWSAPEHDLHQVIRFALDDVHPPLYQIILHYWFLVFGFSEFSGRALSLVFGLLAIPAFHFLATVVYPHSTARLASLVFALSPSAAAFSAEVRSYELLLLLSITSTACLAAWYRYRQLHYLLGYFLVALAGVYTHYFGVILLVCHGISWLLLSFKTGRHRIDWHVPGVFLMLALGFVPLLETVLRGMGRQTFWISNPGVPELLGYIPIYFGGPFAAPLFLVLLVILYLERPRPALREALLILSAVLVLVVPWLMGFVISPVITVRNTIIAVPFWCLLVAWVAAAASPVAGALFRLVCVGIAIIGIILTPIYKGEDIDRLLQAFVEHPAPVFLAKTPELATDTFLQTKIALSGQRYARVEFSVAEPGKVIEARRFWLACYHTCNKLVLDSYRPPHSRIITEVRGKGVRGLLVESEP